ncbi:AAA family ATPase [Xylanimonas sp. McL0601]|uniref:AAA family ATPase n=1 Tax=Xylanimonas sp. McL0601 TaxID=3414739 RepID=UPI003CF6BF1E
MAMPVTVLAAVRGAAETEVVLALGAPGSGATVTRRCGDVVELLAAAAAGAGTVAVVSGDLPGIDRETVARLHGAGVRVVALDDGHGSDRLRALGVDAVLDWAATPGAAGLVEAVREAAGGHAAEHASDASGDPDRGAPELERPGRLVAVWGPVGAPGRTTVALELAAELAGLAGRPGRRTRRGRHVDAPEAPGSVLLVDADTYGSSLAMRLGLLDDAPGLAAACRAAGQGALDVAALARQSPVVAPGLRVLTGITRAARWPEVPASGLEVVLDRARGLAAWTVVDTAAPIEADELLMYDTHAPQRNAATLTALAAANDVVVVGAADPVGIQRLVRALEELREAPVPVPAPAAVVVTRARASAVGPRPEAAVREAMARYAGLDDVVVVPDDAAALDGATLAGRSLAEHAPTSPARTALVGLAGRLRERVG